METKGKKKEREGKKSDHPELRRIVKGLLAATGEEEQVQLLQQIEKKLLTGYRIRVAGDRAAGVGSRLLPRNAFCRCEHSSGFGAKEMGSALSSL